MVDEMKVAQFFKYLVPPGAIQEGDIDQLIATKTPVFREGFAFAWTGIGAELQSDLRGVAVVNPRNRAGKKDFAQAGFTHVRGYFVRPSIRDARWFFPDGPSSRTATHIYVPTTLSGRVKAAWIRLSLHQKSDYVAIAQRTKPILEETLSELLGAPELQLAFSAGTPGPYSKTTVLVLEPVKGPLAYVKIADRWHAIESLRNEEVALKRLESVPSISGSIPRVLGNFSLGSAEAIVISPGPTKPSGSKFTARHLKFLESLQAATSRRLKFAESLMWECIESGYRELRSEVSASWRERLDMVISEAYQRFSACELQMGLAHRDFTPWNIRRSDDGSLFVFDWEFAREEYVPGYDFFHFHVMRDLLLKGRSPFPRLGRYFKEATRMTGADPSSNFLAYLLDVALLYLKGLILRSGTHDDRVLQCVAELIDRRESWYSR